MINFVRYMGIHSCYFFACDYLYDTSIHGYFYLDYKPFNGEHMKNYCDKIKNDIELTLVHTGNKHCSNFKSVAFENHFGLENSYKLKSSFMDNNTLNKLCKAHEKVQIMMKLF